MLLTVTRVGGGAYSITIERDDGVRFVMSGVGRKSTLPHDLAHFVVETALGMDDGFWGSVRVGAVMPGMTHVGGRRKPRAVARSAAILKANSVGLARAEVLVAVFNSAMEGHRPALGALRRDLAERGYVPGGDRCDVSETDLTAVAALWADVQSRWEELAVGETMKLSLRSASGQTDLADARRSGRTSSR